MSDENSLKNATAQLGIRYNTLSSWRNARSRYGKQVFPGSRKNRIPKELIEQRIRKLEKENAELKQTNVILQLSLVFLQFAKRSK